MNVFIMIFSITIFIASLLFTFFVNKKSTGLYDEYIEGLDENEYKLKKMIHIGIYINEKFSIKHKLPKQLKFWFGKYTYELKGKFTELKGIKYAEYYLFIYNAEKTTISLLVILFCSFIGFITVIQKDYTSSMMFSVGGILLSIIFWFLIDSKLNENIEKRHRMLQFEFPEFANKLALLVNAGMTVNKAWEKIAIENNKNTPLYIEIKQAHIDMQDGMDMATAIEAFGKRCRIKEIMKFSMVLVTNLKKGGSELVRILMTQSEECWEMRKIAAKEIGAQAGVKMMIPLVLVLIVILIVVGMPAMMMMNI